MLLDASMGDELHLLVLLVVCILILLCMDAIFQFFPFEFKRFPWDQQMPTLLDQMLDDMTKPWCKKHDLRGNRPNRPDKRPDDRPEK